MHKLIIHQSPICEVRGTPIEHFVGICGGVEGVV